MRTTPLFTLSAVALCLSSTAFAESAEFRQHSAHQHGLVEWVIAQDGNDLLVEIAALAATLWVLNMPQKMTNKQRP